MSTSLKKWAERILLGVVVLLLGTYLLDTGIFLLRQHFNAQPLDTVKVSVTAAVPLKSGKTELDSEGSMVLSCSRTLFPQSTYLPCWYLKRHAMQMDQF